jgi:anti-sigma factor RsiW
MSVDHSQLMRYYDGELGPGEAAEVEAALANDPEAQRVFEGLEQLSAFVRMHDREQAPADDGLTDAIMARVMGEKRGDRSTSAAPEVVRGPWRNIVPAAAAVLALAAGVALVNELSKKSEPLPPVVEQPVAPSEQPVAPVPSLEEPPAEQVLAETDPAVAIETVDFGAREGTIFMMQEGEGSTPVVWLMDDPDPTGSRMEPL